MSDVVSTTTISNIVVPVEVSPGSITEFFSKLHLPSLVDLVIGVGTTVWLYYLIKFPWNLYLSARRARIDGEESQQQGEQQDPKLLQNVKKIEKSLLFGVLAAHTLSAAGVYGIAWLTEGKYISPHAAYLFVGAAIVRPAYEFHSYLHNRIEQLRQRIHYPKDYVTDLINRVNTVEYQTKTHEGYIKALREETLVNHSKQLDKNEKNINQHIEKTKQKLRDLENQVHSTKSALQSEYNSTKSASASHLQRLETKFEENMVRLEADKTMLQGFKQFMGLLRDNLGLRGQDK
eukprot:TRINITY_DN5043_c0_g1_i1.p1 TRINITY_DN5043_c0_g1~~TRINITY_DN5043_c0_g1_i1.p1  ORF type:complete len:290 (+),score=71.08 TRINITY_DN5043_c0_g1_i1:299-1168(+)